MSTNKIHPGPGTNKICKCGVFLAQVCKECVNEKVSEAALVERKKWELAFKVTKLMPTCLYFKEDLSPTQVVATFAKRIADVNEWVGEMCDPGFASLVRQRLEGKEVELSQIIPKGHLFGDVKPNESKG